MTTSSRLWRRKERLFHEQGGRCYWCHGPMRLENGKFQKGERQPKDLCTIDHLRDRFHPARREPAKGEQRLVAACWLCNQMRGRASEKAQPVEELRRRSQAQNEQHP